jgi:hypothetical protein
VTVLADENAKATEQDLKIDAIFLSKALVDGAPGQIETVKVLFTQPGKDGRFISISARELNDYGSGKITAPQLLSFLRFIDVEAEKAPEVQSGSQMERRLLVWRRIEKLKKEGTGVKPFENLFSDMEASAKTGDSEKVETKIAFLESKLSEQEEQLTLARKAARGAGVPARAVTEQHAQGGGTGTASASSASGYIPPEGDALKAAFKFKGDDVVREAETKSPADGRKLREMKSEIEKAFANKQEPTAFMLLHQFQTAAAKIIGYDPLAPGGGPRQQSGNNNNNNQTASGRTQPAVWGRSDSGDQNEGPRGGGPFNGGPQGGGRQGGGPPFGPGGGPPGGGPP